MVSGVVRPAGLAVTAPARPAARGGGTLGSLYPPHAACRQQPGKEPAMLIAGFPAGSFAANCYVVAAGPGEQCLIVDPGQDAAGGIEEIIRRHRLQPAAVLLTHGHIDHIWSVAPVCGARNIPAYIHPSDRALLSDPARGLSRQAGQQFLRGLTFTEPDEVAELADGMTLELAGVQITVDHAPGHTPGSVTFS